jgi:glycosyltransferase involved in cell wall biosynthesis
MRILQVFQCFPDSDNKSHCHFHKVFFNALKENSDFDITNEAVVLVNIFKRRKYGQFISKIYFTGFELFDKIILPIQFKIFCRIKNYDIICFHFLITFLKLGTPCFSSKSILIEHINDFNEYEFIHKYRKNRILGALSKFNKIFGVSDGTTSEIVKYVNSCFNLNCSTMPNIILENTFLKPNFINNKKDYNLFIVGHINKRKDQLFLLKAINHYQSFNFNQTNFKIFIIGDIIDTNYFNELVDYSKENKILIEILPAMENIDLLKFSVSKCDIGINCSSSESFGMVTAEFLSLGIPVLVSNTNGSNYIVNQSGLGYTFEYNSLNDFCLKLNCIITEFETDPIFIKQQIEDRFSPRVVISQFLSEVI